MFVPLKNSLRARVAVMSLCVAALLAATPAPSAWAQNRTLPDFTDLVEQVGPSVVNIRTSEKVKAATAGGGGVDEQMLEFFRRFGIPIPPIWRPIRHVAPAQSVHLRLRKMLSRVAWDPVLF